MSLVRRVTPLLRPLPASLRVASRRKVPPTPCLFFLAQTRGNHTNPLQNPQLGLRSIPSCIAPARGPLHRTEKPTPQETKVLFGANDGKYEYAANSDPGHPEYREFKVNYLRPAIWAVSVSMGIYVFLAFLEAREELKAEEKRMSWVPQWPMQRRAPPTPSEVVTRTWNELDPISKLSWGIIASNGAVHLSSFLAPEAWYSLRHTPALNRSHTLFTSTFVHSGPMHLLINMWACYKFLPATGYSRLFEGNVYHTLSFFLSAGVLSGYAQHLSTKFNFLRPIKGFPRTIIPSGGASGALFAIFGAFCMQYPNAGVGVLLVPVWVDAQYFLPAIMLFDLYGMIRGYPSLNFGHAAHLAGAGLGAAYSYYDGKEKIWKPLVRFWKRQLQKQS